MLDSLNHTYLTTLEQESIRIIREAVAKAEKPLMHYSTGKDSSVMLHLALKAFYQLKPPFPLLHVDTTWKFREMILFRDETVKHLGVELITYTNKEGVQLGVSPFTGWNGSRRAPARHPKRHLCDCRSSMSSRGHAPVTTGNMTLPTNCCRLAREHTWHTPATSCPDP